MIENERWEKSLPLRSSASEYLTFVTTNSENSESIEMHYEDENIWPTHKVMAALYEVKVPTIHHHLNKIYDDGELTKEVTIR